ncbi:autotransporter outer membrane beta-barrel domain-containing protein [Salmonella enterica]|nr:hypothetical protein [Salmonella enterica]EBM9900024.1 autotransporter outer membrane beta-barrel domain-containing protein [Salmonella enterica subsp. enterica serovar Typhimurium]EBV2771923.1 hypothetical protein [Salmonella enterica subsp. enterica serovar Enteritidis]ECK9475795.1 autotransporter outer membrane beta-barrel domain-containing protein [Salmonella enterica subsp. enterica serovar Dublin str. CFSAN000518]EHN5888126.1 autotransporter outer membrane beta-barrel domain-containing
MSVTAVENKFKLNVLAASVLMGLSLSAVASSGPTEAKSSSVASVASSDKAGASDAAKSAADNSKVKDKAVSVKTLADAVGTVKPATINLTVDSKSVSLEDAVKNINGDTGSLKEYTKAQSALEKLGSDKKKQITDYADKQSALTSARNNLDEFHIRAEGVDAVYNSKMSSVFGGDAVHPNAGLVFDGAGGVSGVKINDAIKDNSTLSGNYIASTQSLAHDLTDLKTKALLAAGAGSADATEATKVGKAVDTYLAYLHASHGVTLSQQKLAFAERSVTNALPQFLEVVETYRKADGNTGTKDAPKLNELYDSYLKAVSGYQEAAEKDKADKKNGVFTALQNLVTEVTKSADAAIHGTDDKDHTVGGSLAADKAIVETFKTTLNTAHTAWGVVKTALGTSDTDPGKQLAVLKAASQFANDDTVPAALKGKDITSAQDALAGLDTYLKQLVTLANNNAEKSATDGAKGTNFDTALSTAKGTWEKFKTAKANYDTAFAGLKTAGDARLGLATEWQKANSAYSDAVDAYNLAKIQYDAIPEVGKLNTARADYISALQSTSDAVKKVIDAAGATYKGAVKPVGGTATTQQQKNEALYTLISQKKVLVPVQVQMDKEHLLLVMQDLSDKQSALSAASKDKAEAEKAWNTAAKDYLAASGRFAESKSVTDEIAMSVAEHQLLNLSGKAKLDDIVVADTKTDKTPPQFVEFSSLKDSAPALKAETEAEEAFSGTSGISGLRKNLVDGLKSLSGLMPLSGADEQKSFRATYNDALKAIGTESTSAEVQSKVANAESITHYLGGLPEAEAGSYDKASGRYKSVVVNVDDKGNVTGVKDNFTGKDLYTGSKDKPFTTTVLNIEAPELGNGALADTNSITVGEAADKGKKATPIEVWAKTAGAKWDDKTGKYDKSGNGPAVKLSGELRTTTAQLDENGKPVAGEVVRGADQIVLQNVNINNSFTLDDKVQMLKNDVNALNKGTEDKVALGQPVNSATKSELQTKADALNGKYDGLKLTGLNIDTHTVNPSFDVGNTGDWKKGKDIYVQSAPTAANILLDNLNITLQNDSDGGLSTAIDLSGTGNHILANGGVFDSGQVTGKNSQADVLNISGTNNLIDFNGSVLKGDIRSSASGNTVNLTNGSLTGDAISGDGMLGLSLSGSTWIGGAGSNSPDVSLSNNSVWNVTGSSHVSSLSLSGSNTLNLIYSGGQSKLGGHGFTGYKEASSLAVGTDLTSDGKGVTSVLAGTYSPDNLHSLTNIGLARGYQFGALDVDGLATGGKYALSLESAGAEPYTIGGRLADRADVAHAFVSYDTSANRVAPGKDKDAAPVVVPTPSTADFITLSAPAELGVYQYAAEKVIDAANNRTGIYYSSTGKLSNSAATAVSLAAAPVDVANLQSDTLAKHMNSVRRGKDSGVWLSYFGGENRNTTAAGPEYRLKTNGVMLGVDTLTENNWLAGVAVSSARSDMSVMNSSGDLDSYGAQFYMSRRYDSGVFVDGALQFNHFSNTAKARMINGQQAKADFSGNSYGAEAKVGYSWNSEGFFAEPYVRAAARAFDGEHYALSNGMTVNSNDYKSMQGEVGADLGYEYAISGGYVKPYLHLAALNEFADGNSVRVNNVSLDNSVKGSAFQAGLGAEVKVTDNLGGYAAFDYLKGENTERPWQATVGVNYTW